ncbi:PQQ-binding-like beta-propeller repeat protein [Microbacterium sp. NPDC008134]|uniref:outer membrane protein assembly factor BamB family protein n=1 Tax=Microbacterium sp. NPDC008134 TaxID=3364183 RepID=UPI0036E6C435
MTGAAEQESGNEPEHDHALAPEEQRRPGLISAAGVSLLVAGWVTTLVATWWVPQGRVETDQGPATIAVHTCAIIAAVFLVVTIVLWLRGRFPRWTAFLAAVPLCVLIPSAQRGLSDELANGWVSPDTVVTLIGAIASGTGAVLMLTASFLPARRAARRTAVAAVMSLCALLVAAACVVCAAWWAPTAKLTATTAPEAAGPAPALPDDLSAVVWTAELPRPANDVQLAGDGIVALVEDGVVALDSETGEQRWEYRRDGVVTPLLRVSGDGRTVAFVWEPASRGVREYVFLDADTGRELHRGASDDPESPALSERMPIVGADAYVAIDDERRAFIAFSFRTGEELWRYPVPDECEPFSTWRALRTAGAVVLPLDCGASSAAGRELRLLTMATDATVAREDTFAFERYGELWTADDGSALYVALDSGDEPTVRVDLATGEQRTVAEEELGWTIEGNDDVMLAEESRGHRARMVWIGDARRLQVDSTDGRLLGIVKFPCAFLYEIVVTDLLAACIQFDESGFTAGVSPFDGDTRSIGIDLHIDVDEFHGERGYGLLRAPGAWVAWAADDPEGEQTPVLVGLR